MGRVIRTESDKNGLVRSVHLKTQTSELRRPVDKVVLLLAKEEQLWLEINKEAKAWKDWTSYGSFIVPFLSGLYKGFDWLVYSFAQDMTNQFSNSVRTFRVKHRLKGRECYCRYANLVPRVSLLCLPWSLEKRPWLRLVTWQPVTQTFPPG